MERPQFILPPTANGSCYSQAVRVGNRVETSGQGGWRDDGTCPEALHDEIAQAFDNLEHVLTLAGATWDDVISVNSYHMPIDTETYDIMCAQFRVRMPNHAPIWTCTSVPNFGVAGMRVEIRITAIIGMGEPPTS